MIKSIGHLGLFVNNIEQSLDALSKIVGFQEPTVREFPEAGVRCAVADLSGISLEFIQGIQADSPLSQFVKEKGDIIHHFCLLSDNIAKDVADLKKRGVEMADQEPRIGLRGKKIALTTPNALNGITIELSEP